MKPKKSGADITCPHCGKRASTRKTVFCPDCGHGLCTPRITKKWNYSVLGAVFLILIILYIIFLLLEPRLYFLLDRVIIR